MCVLRIYADVYVYMYMCTYGCVRLIREHACNGLCDSCYVQYLEKYSCCGRRLRVELEDLGKSQRDSERLSKCCVECAGGASC